MGVRLLLQLKGGMHMKKIFMIITCFVVLTMFVGCSVSKSNDKNEPMVARTNLELIKELSDKEFNVENKIISDDILKEFVTSFYNLYCGSVSENHRPSFNNYIKNNNLLEYVERIWVCDQKQVAKHNSFHTFGIDNELVEFEIVKKAENLWYLKLMYEYKGSGQGMRVLIENDDNHLSIVDLYFGGKDSADSFSQEWNRELENPKMWEDDKRVDNIFKKLEEFESKL